MFGKLVFIEILNSKADDNKPRAKKGLTRSILCQLIHYGLKKKLFSKKVDIGLEPGNLKNKGQKHNQVKLTQMYEKMGFEIFPQSEEALKISLDNFFKWCDSTYGSKHLEIMSKSKKQKK